MSKGNETFIVERVEIETLGLEKWLMKNANLEFKADKRQKKENRAFDILAHALEYVFFKAIREEIIEVKSRTDVLAFVRMLCPDSRQTLPPQEQCLSGRNL